MTFVDNVYKVCYDKGLKPAQVMSELGYTHQRISTWRARGTVPPASHITRIAERLDVAPETLVAGLTVAKSAIGTIVDVNSLKFGTPVQEQPTEISERELHIILQIRKLPEESRKRIENYIDGYCAAVSEMSR